MLQCDIKDIRRRRFGKAPAGVAAPAELLKLDRIRPGRSAETNRALPAMDKVQAVPLVAR